MTTAPIPWQCGGDFWTLTTQSFAATFASTSLAKVEAVYNNFSQLVTEYQEHSGAVNTSTSPKVQYAYANGADNHIRPTSLTYPDGRSIDYDYGTAGGTDDAASRVQTLKEGAVALAEYSYLGQQSVVEVDYTEPDLRYTLVDLAGSDDPDTGDIYSGLDRFGRVKDSRWYDYGSSADAERIKYGYDRAGNRTYREVTLDPGDAHDELYGYDGSHRLAEFERGSLSGAKDAISSLEFAQQWSLDPTGNWSGFKQDADGDSTWDLDQSRSHNSVNEISGISETAGTAWATPGHDRAGNLTSLPQPAALDQSYTAVWDGWNRLVKLVDAGTSDTVQENAYDGRKFRIVRKDYVSGSLDETRHVYYTSEWQAIEERLGSSSDAERQTVWGLRYIDDVLLRDRDTTGNGTLDERLYALQDGNWNVTAVADDGGTVQERYAYTAYGRVAYLSGSFAVRGSSSHAWEHLYTGRSLDATGGLYSFRNRMYHPELGRWCSRDPIGYEKKRMEFARVCGLQSSDREKDPMGLLLSPWKTDPAELYPHVPDHLFVGQT